MILNILKKQPKTTKSLTGLHLVQYKNTGLQCLTFLIIT